MPRLTEAQQALAAKPEHIEWTENLLRPWLRSYPWLAEELRTAALLGLMDAARTFDGGRGTKFTSYLSTCIRTRFLNAMRCSRRAFRSGARAEHITPHYDPADPRYDEPCPGETMTVLLASLPHDEADLLSRVVCDGETLTEAGRPYGFSKQTAKNHMTRSLRTLRHHSVLAGAR